MRPVQLLKGGVKVNVLAVDVAMPLFVGVPAVSHPKAAALVVLSIEYAVPTVGYVDVTETVVALGATKLVPLRVQVSASVPLTIAVLDTARADVVPVTDKVIGTDKSSDEPVVTVDFCV